MKTYSASPSPKMLRSALSAKDISGEQGLFNDFSSGVYSYNQLDECIKTQYSRFHITTSYSAADFTSPPQNRDLDRLNNLLHKLKTQQQLQQIIDLVLTTKFSSVRNRCLEFYMGVFLRPLERGGNTNFNQDYNEGNSIGVSQYLDLVLSGFPQIFPAFDTEDRADLLEALASLLLQVTPEMNGHNNNKSHGHIENNHIYQSVIKTCTSIVLKCIDIDFNNDLVITFVKSVLQNCITVASNISASTSNNKVIAEYALNYLPFIAELEEFVSPATNTKSVSHSNDIFSNVFHPIKRDVDQDLIRLVQQYMIVCVMFTVNDPKILNEWSEPLDRISRFLPALLQRKPKVDFSSVRIRIQELLSLVKPKSFQKTEDIYPIFANIFPNVPARQFLTLDLADSVYALSIYYIEMIRAERGIVGPIFEYIEVKYNPAFKVLLDAMFDPILKTFYSYLSSVSDIERRTSCAAFTMKELITRSCSPAERVVKRIDPILKSFADSYPFVVCDLQVIGAITESLSKADSHVQKPHHFEKLVQKLLSDALVVAPDLLFSAIFHSQVQATPYKAIEESHTLITPSLLNRNPNVSQSNSKTSSFINLNAKSTFESLLKFSFTDSDEEDNLMNKVNVTSGQSTRIIDLLPSDVRAKYTNELVAKGIALGQAQFAPSIESIRKVTDYETRIMLTASYFILHPNQPDVLNDLISHEGQDPDVLMIAWSHISMYSTKLSKILVSSLLDAFRDTIENGLGIFAAGREEELNLGSHRDRNIGNNPDHDSTLRVINYQTKVLNFFNELQAVGLHHARFSTIVIPAMNRKLLNSSSIIPAVLSLAHLVTVILNTPYEISQRLQIELKDFVLKLSLTAYSYIYDDYVYQYVTHLEIFYLERLATLLPSTLCMSSSSSAEMQSSSKSGKDKTKPSSGNQSLSVSANNHSHSKGKVDSEVQSAIELSRSNYVKQKSTDASMFDTFVNLVSFLVCDELQLFAMYNDQLSAYSDPSLQRLLTLRQMKPKGMHLKNTVRMIWRSEPEAIYPFCLMPGKSTGKSVMAVVSQLMEKDLYTAPSVPMLSLLYVQIPKFNPHPLALWKAMPANKALSLLCPTMMSDKSAASYVARCFQKFSKRESLLFLPQLVQSLRFDKNGIMRDFLTKYCKRSEVFTHYLLWNILAEKENHVGPSDNLPKILTDLEKTIIENMNEQEKQNYQNEFSLIDRLDEVSQKLLKMEIDKRPPALVDMLKDMKLPEGLYIPSNPNYKIISIDAERSLPLKSHARVPILVNFTVYDEDAELEEAAKQQQQQKQQNQGSDSDDNKNENEEESTKEREVAHSDDNDNDDDDDNEMSEVSTDDDDNNNDNQASKKSKKDKKKSKKEKKKAKKEKKKNDKKKKSKKKPLESQYLNNESTERNLQNEEYNRQLRERLLKKHKPILFSCIFKINDDVRQDAMMIQFIDMTKQILIDAGIDAFLFPYRVFTTGKDRGVIECIQHAKSRHDIGVSTNEDMLTYFINKYGQVGTPEFNTAQNNFIKSVAPYSLICYLFQVRDRHNANIMLDDDGHIIHIDFGFIFEISPGGNMKFERSPFKLTKEYIDLLGGSKEAPAFQRFTRLFVQCFFAVRARHQELEAITALMMNAGFPCFLNDSIKKLQQRFFIDKSAKETLNEVLKLIDSAYEAKSTAMYDVLQKAQNDIFY